MAVGAQDLYFSEEAMQANIPAKTKGLTDYSTQAKLLNPALYPDPHTELERQPELKDEKIAKFLLSPAHKPAEKRAKLQDWLAIVTSKYKKMNYSKMDNSEKQKIIKDIQSLLASMAILSPSLKSQLIKDKIINDDASIASIQNNQFKINQMLDYLAQLQTEKFKKEIEANLANYSQRTNEEDRKWLLKMQGFLSPQQVEKLSSLIEMQHDQTRFDPYARIGVVLAGFLLNNLAEEYNLPDLLPEKKGTSENNEDIASQDYLSKMAATQANMGQANPAKNK